MVSKLDFTSRLATRKDKEKVAMLCRRAMGEDDYVIDVLDETIPAGGLFLALDDSRIIGIANFQKIADGAAWLSMARTDPEYRGKRVAGFLQNVIASHAREQGLKSLRFLVNSSNTPSLRSANRGGFRPITETAHVSYSLKEGKYRFKDDAVKVKVLSDSEASSIVSDSNYLDALDGYFARGWHFEKASAKELRDASEKGKVVASAELKNVFLFGCAEDWDPDKEDHATFFLLKGTFGRTLEMVKEYAASLNFGSVGAFLPYNRYLIRNALGEHSFKVDPWADHGIVFERKI